LRSGGWGDFASFVAKICAAAFDTPALRMSDFFSSNFPSAPVLLSMNRLAHRVGRHRSVIERLLRQRRLSPDAYIVVDDGATLHPVFAPDRAVEVLKQMKPRRLSARADSVPAEPPAAA
jgi:hypothetical protein